jgi:hypothetical protein
MANRSPPSDPPLSIPRVVPASRRPWRSSMLTDARAQGSIVRDERAGDEEMKSRADRGASAGS